jgi:aryl-alcohol dehydrogenase-like predicted oxidoreductase
VILALEKAREQGKIRVIAYSGENDALDFAIGTGRFGSIQCSANLFDQRGIDHQIRGAREKGMGIIAKRPLGNAVWRYGSRPDGHGHAAYYDRFLLMGLDPGGTVWEEIALRFTAFSTGTDCMILGTSSEEHLRSGLSFLNNGPLEEDLLNRIRSAFNDHGRNWPGLI